MTAQTSRRAVIGGSHCSWTALQLLAPELAAHFFESTDAANQKLIEIEVCPRPPLATGKSNMTRKSLNHNSVGLSGPVASCLFNLTW